MSAFELGYELRWVDNELHGRAPVDIGVCVPGTTSLRTSVLATFVDVTAGYLAVDAMAPLIPVTLALEVSLHQPVPSCDSIRWSGRVIAAGRSVTSFMIEFATADGRPIALGTASFMAPDPNVRMPEHLNVDWRQPHAVPRSSGVFADAAGCERTSPGEARLSGSETNRNASGTVNGALLALVVEEAALSTTPDTTVGNLSMRYLRPVRVGPAVANATKAGPICVVEVHDAGQADRLAVSAVVRLF